MTKLDCSYYNKEFRRKINRRNTSYSDRVGTLEVDDYINEAARIWYKTAVAEAEQNTAIRVSLRPFEVKHKPLEVECKGLYYIAGIPEDCYYPLNYVIYASKDGCDNCPKLMTPFVVQSDDLVESLKDPDRNPSFEYGEVLIDDANDYLHIYTDGTFSIDKIDLSYYKKLGKQACPKLVDTNYYVDSIGNKVDTNTTFLIENEDDADEIVDMAVLFFLRDVGDNTELDTQLTKINMKFKILRNIN